MFSTFRTQLECQGNRAGHFGLHAKFLDARVITHAHLTKPPYHPRHTFSVVSCPLAVSSLASASRRMLLASDTFSDIAFHSSAMVGHKQEVFIKMSGRIRITSNLHNLTSEQQTSECVQFFILFLHQSYQFFLFTIQLTLDPLYLSLKQGGKVRQSFVQNQKRAQMGDV